MGSRRVSLAVVLLLLVSLLGGVSGAGAAPDSPDNAAPIRLKAATFHPGLGERPDIPPGLTIAGYAQGQRGYYLVQFAGPVEQSWKDQVVATGAELIDYVPDFAFKTRMTPAEAARVERVDAVAWVGLFHPAYKLSPDLLRGGQHLYSIRVELGADGDLTAAAVARSGAQILGREDQHLLVAADATQLDAIAHVLDVAWVSNFLLPEKHNEVGGGQIMGADTANTNGYDGSTQTVAVADTGLGNGTEEGAHPDIPGGTNDSSDRIVAINNWAGASTSCYNVVDDGAIDVDSGHGTHVAGSVLSDGGAGGVGKGTAPAAKLVFQAVENWADMKGICAFSYPDGYYLIGLPSDLRQVFQQAYDQGARIHSNSWGSDVNGDYTADSAYADDFIWNRRDMTITFSAGNSGKDTNNDGVVDNDSIGSPATAKNVITVGASENDRNGSYPCDTNLQYASHDSYQNGKTCSEMNGQNVLGTGSRWGFNTEPLKSDPTAGNQEQMALFSSRGPTDDGRIKPDVVAPGTWILSGYSGLYQEHYDGNSTNPQNGLYQWDGWGMPYIADYKWMGGTSMSNPLAAGGAAVVRDYYQKAHGVNASAALTKATLINSAVDMLDENNDGNPDGKHDYPIPNNHEGWGRVNLANATDGSHRFVDQTAGLSTGGSATYQYGVNTSGAPLKVTLVWSDYPSTASASRNLVNDLDLVVTAPNGAVYRGNVFSGGWSQSGGSADRINNVENVYVSSTASGSWTVEVKGYNVPNGPQPYALVVDGSFSTSSETNNAPVANNDSYSISEGQTLAVAAPGVLGNDTDSDGDSLTASIASAPNHGTVTLNNDGSFTYTHDGSETTSDSFTYRANDGVADSNMATVSLTINLVNDPPVAADKSVTASVDTTVTVTLTGTDADNCELTFSIVTGPANGSLGSNTNTGCASGSPNSDSATVTYTPNSGYSGSDSFTYKVNDGTADSNTATVSITVNAESTNMHVGDLDGSSVNNGSTWTANVTITVHDANHNPVPNATVSGSWSNGASGTGSCETNSNGQCTVSKGSIRKNTSSVTFSVSNVTHSTLTYISSANHDPDGDSNGTSITVNKP